MVTAIQVILVGEQCVKEGISLQRLLVLVPLAQEDGAALS